MEEDKEEVESPPIVKDKIYVKKRLNTTKAEQLFYNSLLVWIHCNSGLCY